MESLEELGHDHEEQRDDGADLGGLQVEGVDLGAEARREVVILNLLQPTAVNVPDAALPDVS